MSLKCHLSDTFANGICLCWRKGEQLLPGCLVPPTDRDVFILDRIGLIGEAAITKKKKNNKKTNELESEIKLEAHLRQQQIVTFQWALLNVLHFNTIRLAPSSSRGALHCLSVRPSVCVPHLGQRVRFQHSKNHKTKSENGKKKKPTTPILIGPKQSNQWIRYTFIHHIFFLLL